MPITRETLELVANLRRNVGSITDEVVRSLTAAWVRAWDDVAFEVAAAIGELLSVGGIGGRPSGRSNDPAGLSRRWTWPSRRQIDRSRRAIKALDLVRQALERLAALTNQTASRAANEIARITYTAQPDLIASQLPPGSRLQLAIRFGRSDQDPIAAIVTRTIQQITSRTRPLSRDATDAVKSELIRGVAMGDNPRESARRMLRRVEGAFNGGAARALTIARTEILDASRAAADASQADHADVLDGWVWNASLDPRVCGACLAMHGTEHQLSEPGPQGHPNCRCSRTPKTTSWADLGFDMPEAEGLLPDGRDWFDNLTRAEQQQIMGKTRLDLLASGAIDWGDIPVRRDNPDWRPSYQVRPLKDVPRRQRRAA